MNKSAKAILLVALAGAITLVVWLGRGNAPQPGSATTNDHPANEVGQQVPTATDDASRAPSRKTAAEQLSPDGGAPIPVPPEWALVPGDSVPAASNWEELVAGLSPEERELAEAFAARYPEAYDFTKPEQLRWMLENGYPSPREMIEAQIMPRDDLVALAKSGNAKAQILAIDLESDELFRTFDQLPENERAERWIDLVMMRPDVLSSCSPFAGYVSMTHDRLMRRNDQSSKPYEIVARLNFIVTLGDWRAEEAMRTAITELGLQQTQAGELTSWSSLSFGPIVRRQCGTHLLPH